MRHKPYLIRCRIYRQKFSSDSRYNEAVYKLIYIFRNQSTEGSEFSWNYESIRILDVYLGSIVTLSTTMCTGKTVLPSQHTTRIHGNYTLSHNTIIIQQEYKTVGIPTTQTSIIHSHIHDACLYNTVLIKHTYTQFMCLFLQLATKRTGL